MYQIRKGVFETNSSSSHSISISSSDHFTDILHGINGVIYVTGDEFGWGCESISGAYEKLQYLITGLFSDCNSQVDVEDVKENNNYYKMLERVIKKYCNCSLYIKKSIGGQKYYDYGYIDHQSYDVYSEAFNSESDLANYLFNPQSILYIDHDNH